MDNVFRDVEDLATAGILNKLDQGKTDAGINQLEALINGGVFDDDEGNDLIDQIAKAIVSAS